MGMECSRGVPLLELLSVKVNNTYLHYQARTHLCVRGLPRPIRIYMHSFGVERFELATVFLSENLYVE